QGAHALGPAGRAAGLEAPQPPEVRRGGQGGEPFFAQGDALEAQLGQAGQPRRGEQGPRVVGRGASSSGWSRMSWRKASFMRPRLVGARRGGWRDSIRAGG